MQIASTQAYNHHVYYTLSFFDLNTTYSARWEACARHTPVQRLLAAPSQAGLLQGCLGDLVSVLTTGIHLTQLHKLGGNCRVLGRA